ncbi:MAG: LytTR family DNA-binding domain-containing protein [Lachnospiraceae bacterium]|nr:LytTR family DNA-binding domain-containing protein [Lachnospiraceae bacterium]
MLNIAICDDDLIFASRIETILLEISRYRLIEMDIEVYSDGSELWKDVFSGKVFDLLYLDIEMVQLNGIDVAKRIRENNTSVIIIYISNYDNYFIELFEVEPFRFIKKPVDEKIFLSYFDKAYERIIQDEAYFEYKFNKIPHKILTKDIIYFESSGRLIKVLDTNGEGKFYGKLNILERQLQSGKISFLRIHQSYLVNYCFIKEISFSKVVLMDGTELQISEDRQKAIRARYNELLGGEFLDG